MSSSRNSQKATATQILVIRDPGHCPSGAVGKAVGNGGLQRGCQIGNAGLAVARLDGGEPCRHRRFQAGE